MLPRGLRSGLIIRVVVAALLSATVVLSAAVVGTAGASATRPIDHARGSDTAEPSAAAVDHAAWYVGLTSAGTRIDFRTSPAGGWVRDFRFGFPVLTRLGLTFELMPDGSFPLRGLPIRQAAFAGDVEAVDPSANYADAAPVTVTGHFINQQQVTGTLQASDRGGGYDPLTFTASRAGSLPAPPTRSGRYFGLPLSGPDISFQVSRSGRRVTNFKVASTLSQGKCNDSSSTFKLAKSYPVGGLRQDRDGVFAGVVSSRVSHGRPAGTRVRVSVLFLSSAEATGTLQLLAGERVSTRGSSGGKCGYGTLPFRAAISTEIIR